MASTTQLSKNFSSSQGMDAARQADVLASCYLVDAAGSLNKLHYCTTSLTGAECPPLAAITASNELALTPKKRSIRGGNNNTRSNNNRGRGGATLRIREECERFFCETMKAVFFGERSTAGKVSGLTGVHYYDNYYGNGGNGQLNTPPDEAPPFPLPDKTRAAGAADGGLAVGSGSGSGAGVTAWLEIWDYVGGASFRAFVAEHKGEKSLFAFFDTGVIGRDLKQALVALIELADAALGCSQLVICIDRSIPEEDAKELMKGLQWAGFSLTTLDFWAGGIDVTSKTWLLMGMEI